MKGEEVDMTHYLNLMVKVMDEKPDCYENILRLCDVSFGLSNDRFNRIKKYIKFLKYQ